MTEYHKIDSIFKRDQRGNFLFGEWSRPEFEYLQDTPWRWTEKIDGTNIRIIWPNVAHPQDHITFGGRTDNAQLPTKLLIWLQEWYAENQWNMRNTLPPGVVLYGEGYGAGIQNGGSYSAEQKFILFDVRIGNWWLQRKDVEDIATKLNLDVVQEYFDYLTLNNAIELMKSGKDIIGVSAFNLPDGKPEGYVGTPVVPLFARNGDRIITKIKYKDFA